ncbi:MAG: cation diffusion facilitator family transporter [Actinomycetota bacterium]
MVKKDLKALNKRRIAAFSLAVSIFLVITKVAAAYLSNSLGIFSEALNNGLDLVTVFITFLAIRMSTKPADRDHTYGHGKYENFSAFIEVVIISGLGFFIIYKSVQRLIYRDFELFLTWPIFFILGLSVVLNTIRVILLRNAAKKYHSFAFRAEFINYSGDIVSSVVVIAGLILARAGIYIADPIASILVALVVIFLSLRLSVSIIRNLLDYIPREVTEEIGGIVAKIKEIGKINDLKIHEVGGIKFINLDLSIPNNFYLSQTENIKDKVRGKIRETFPGSNIIVEIKPGLSDDNISDYIKGVALNHPDIEDVHNVYVYSVGKDMDVSLHVKLSRDMDLGEVEELTKDTEKQLKDQIKSLRRIYIHSEDMSTRDGWDDVTLQSEKLIEDIKENISPSINPDTCHNFTVLRKDSYYHVAFHCRLEGNLKIEEAHKIITEVEDLLKTKVQEIDEVLIHAEPY